MLQTKRKSGVEVLGIVEMRDLNGKINDAVFEFLLPGAEFIIPVLPTRCEPPSDLSRNVKDAMSRAGELWNFYDLGYQDVVQFRMDLSEMHTSDFDSDAELAEMEARLEVIELLMRDLLIKKVTPRLVFWITSKAYFDAIPDIDPFDMCRLS